MTNSPWEFEPLSPKNHDAVRTLILAGLADHWGELDPTLNRDLDDMFASYAAGTTVVATAESGVVGTGTLMPRDSSTAEIVRMSVSSHMRRCGLGRAIVAELLTHARAQNHAHVILETSSAWTEVVAFYESCGFSITHTESSDFGDDTWFHMPLRPESGFL